jgi:DNA polymerase
MDSDLAPLVLVTIHPSAVLRSTDRAAREAAMAGLVEDLRVAAGGAAVPPARPRRTP